MLTEAGILDVVDHPFLATLYGTIQTDTHLHFLMEYCEGGELYGLLTSQPNKRIKEAHMRFYSAEVGSLLAERCLVVCKGTWMSSACMVRAVAQWCTAFVIRFQRVVF